MPNKDEDKYLFSLVQRQNNWLMIWAKTGKDAALQEALRLGEKQDKWWREYHRNLNSLLAKKFPSQRVNWKKEKQIFEKNYGVEIVTFDGLYLREKIFRTITHIEDSRIQLYKARDVIDAEYYVENFIYRAVQLRNALLKFYKGSLIKPDASKAKEVSDNFENASLVRVLIVYRDSLFHEGRIYPVVGITDFENSILPKPIIFHPKQKLLNMCTYKNWCEDWDLTIRIYLRALKKILSD